MDALIVGATVEDLDIKDLIDLLNKTDNPDIILVYNNLNKGSRNHLRAFIAQIESLGASILLSIYLKYFLIKPFLLIRKGD